MLLISTVTGCAAFRGGTFRGEKGASNSLDSESKDRIRRHYDAGQVESSLEALRDWIEINGYDLVNYRTNIVLNIAAGEFSEDLYDETIIDNILMARRSEDRSDRMYSYWYRYTIDWSFEPFTQRVARDVAPKTPEGSVARLLANYIGGIDDSIFTRLKQPEYTSTRLRAYHDARVRLLQRNSTGENLNLYTGAWIPTGDASSLASHPLIGTMMGGSLQGYRYDVVGELRLLNATDPFVAISDGDTVTTTNYLGFYTGLEVARDLIRSSRHDLYLSGGFGVDGFSYDNMNDDVSRRSVTAFAATIGVGYRYHLEPLALRYFGVQAMYHFIDYNRMAGPQLAGDAVTIRLMVGWGGNERTNDKLRALSY